MKYPFVVNMRLRHFQLLVCCGGKMAAIVHSSDNKDEVFVISDSEEEPDNQVAENTKNTSKTDHKSLFDEFVTCTDDLLTKIRDKPQSEKIRKALLKAFKAARQDYVSSEEFANTIQQHLTELKKPDIKDGTIFSVVRDVVILLKNASKPKKPKGRKSKPDAEKTEDRVVSNGGVETNGANVKTEPTCDGSEQLEPCGSKDVNDVKPTGDVKNEITLNNDCVQGLTSSEDGKAVVESKSEEKVSESIDQNKPSTSKDENDKKGDSNDKSKKSKIRRMEKLMGKLDKEIKRYSEKELTLEEMERDDSSHMIEHKLRKRCVEAWQKWCKLKGYEAKTGRCTEKKVKFEGTRYPEINLKIQKLVKHNKFPDFHDVYHVIKKTNSVKKLGIHKFDLQPLATEVFKDVGETLSRRRRNDDMYNAGYASFIDTPEDPANENPELRTTLEENANKGRDMMDKVMEKYTQKAREMHTPGVEPEFDRTSEPEAIPDESENEYEEGDWVEYVSDSDESQSAEPSEAKVPETEATNVETCDDKKNALEISAGESEKRPHEGESLSCDDIAVRKKIKLEHSNTDSEETGKTSVTLNGICESIPVVKSASESKTTSPVNPSQETVKVDTARQSVHLKLLHETRQVEVPSPSKVTPCSVSLPKKKLLPICISSGKSVPISQQKQSQTVSISSGTATPPCDPVGNLSKEEVGKSLMDVKKVQMEPGKVLKGGTPLPHQTQVNESSTSTGSLLNKAASCRTPFSSPSSSGSSSTNTNGQHRRVQLISLPSTSSSSTAKSNVPSQIILNLNPTSSTKPNVPSVKVPSSRVHTNGNVVVLTQTGNALSNQRRNPGVVKLRQSVASHHSKTILIKTQSNHSNRPKQSNQSNRPKQSYQEDDDGVIVLD